MTKAVYVVPKLLLIFLFQTGSHRKDFLVCADSRYDITYSCGADLVCFYLWSNVGTAKPSSFIGIVSNGEIGMSESLGDDSKCYLPFEHLSVENAGQHHCRRGSGVFRQYNNSPVYNLTPEKPVSLQCIFFKYKKNGKCSHYSEQVSLTWVDENGVEIEEDSEHQIQHQSPCAVTLHIALKTPRIRIVRCQMTVGIIAWTSAHLLVQLPEGRGKRILEPKHQEHNQRDVMIGAAVGVVGCALVAAFIVRKRLAKSNIQPSDDSLNAVTPNNEADINDVIYTEITFPVDSGQEWVKQREDTEYATVRY